MGTSCNMFGLPNRILHILASYYCSIHTIKLTCLPTVLTFRICIVSLHVIDMLTLLMFLHGDYRENKTTYQPQSHPSPI